MNDDLISRKEAEDALLFSMAMTGYQQRAIDTIRFLPSIEDRIVNIGQWHSVKDMVPEDFKTVLVLRDDIPGGLVRTAWIVEGHWSVPNNVNVTHWMELPEPPKDGDC